MVEEGVGARRKADQGVGGNATKWSFGRDATKTSLVEIMQMQLLGFEDCLIDEGEIEITFQRWFFNSLDFALECCLLSDRRSRLYSFLLTRGR